MATQKQAHDWQIKNHGKWIDMDGWYGAQCMDLIIKFCVDLFGWWPKGNAKDMWTQKLPKGWTRIKNTPSFRPQQGDIVVWKPARWNGNAGHTAIATGKKPTLSKFYTMDQNWFNASQTKGSKASYVTHGYVGTYAIYGVVRPLWTKAPVKKPTPKPPVKKPTPKPTKPPVLKPVIDSAELKQSKENNGLLKQIIDLIKRIFNIKE